MRSATATRQDRKSSNPSIETSDAGATHSSDQCRTQLIAAITSPVGAGTAHTVATYLVSQPNSSLKEILLALPEQIEVGVLYGQLAHAMGAASCSNSAHWSDLVWAIGRASTSTPPRMTGHETLCVLHHCAKGMGMAGITQLSTWLEVLDALPSGLDSETHVALVCGMATPMDAVGMEQEVLWRSFVDASLTIQQAASPHHKAPFTQVARFLGQARVSCQIPWQMLVKDLSASRDWSWGERIHGRTDILASLLLTGVDEKRFSSVLQEFQPGPVAAALAKASIQDSRLWQLTIEASSREGGAEILAIAASMIDARPTRAQAWATLANALCAPSQTATLLRHVIKALDLMPSFALELCLVVTQKARGLDESELKSICQDLKKYFNSESAQTLFKGSACKSLVAPLSRLVLGTDDELLPHRAFARMGVQRVCNILLNQHAAVAPAHQDIYRAVLRNVIQTGKLGLASIAQVEEHRQSVRASAPFIHWDMVFTPAAAGAPRLKFCSFPALQDAVDTFGMNLKALMLGVNAYMQGFHARHVAKEDQERLQVSKQVNGPFKDLLQIVAGLEKHFFNQLVSAIWGERAGPQIVRGGTLLSRLLATDATEKVTLRADISVLVEEIQKTVAAWNSVPAELVTCVASMKAAWSDLIILFERPDFAQSHAHFGDYELTLIDPDDAATLLIGEEVACCLSPTGSHAGSLLERLVGGWILLAVKDADDRTLAVAWTALNQRGELTIDFLDERVSHSQPPLGNHVARQLVDFVPVVANAIGAKPVAWLGDTRYGRLTDIETLKDRNWECLDMTMLTPPLAGVPMYTDHLNKIATGSTRYARL